VVHSRFAAEAYGRELYSGNNGEHPVPIQGLGAQRGEAWSSRWGLLRAKYFAPTSRAAIILRSSLLSYDEKRRRSEVSEASRYHWLRARRITSRRSRPQAIDAIEPPLLIRWIDSAAAQKGRACSSRLCCFFLCLLSDCVAWCVRPERQSPSVSVGEILGLPVAHAFLEGVTVFSVWMRTSMNVPLSLATVLVLARHSLAHRGGGY